MVVTKSTAVAVNLILVTELCFLFIVFPAYKKHIYNVYAYIRNTNKTNTHTLATQFKKENTTKLQKFPGYPFALHPISISKR